MVGGKLAGLVSKRYKEGFMKTSILKSIVAFLAGWVALYGIHVLIPAIH